MRNRVLLVVVVTLVGSLVGLAKDRASREQGAQGPRTRAQLQDLSPEERAKLREQWQNMSEEERAQLKAKMRDQVGAAPGGARTPAAQITALKQERQATVGELQAIAKLAVKENATETAKALERLIAKHEARFQTRIKLLEQRLAKVQGEEKATPEAKAKADKANRPAEQRKKRAERQRQE